MILGHLLLAPAVLATSVAYLVFLSTPLGLEPGGEVLHVSRTFGSPRLTFLCGWLKLISYLSAAAYLADALAGNLLELFGAQHTAALQQAVRRAIAHPQEEFVSREALQGYHRERSDQALSAVRAELDRAGIGYTQHQFIGDPGRVIAACAVEQHADEIVMGTRGLGTHTGGVVGSVTQSTLEHATVPVVVVK